MGKKMKFPASLLKAKQGSTTTTAAVSPWLWPACVHDPKTLSFRSSSNLVNMEHCYSTDSSDAAPDSSHRRRGKETTFSPSSETASTGYQNPNVDDSSTAAVLQGLKSSRLFFEPGKTSSILEAKTHHHPLHNNVTILAMDSTDPLTDFSVSMAEMVEAHGRRDWDFLEELLSCYLRVNAKSNHGFIVGAFVDLLLHLHLAAAAAAIDEHCSSSSTATQCSFTSHLSLSSSTRSSVNPCLSPLEDEDEIIAQKI